MAVEIEQPNVLVVEGREEELFFGALIKHLGLQNIQAMPIGGKEQLRRNLKALVVSPGFPEVISLGVVRDANADPGAAFQSVHDALQAVNLPAPERPLMPVGERPRLDGDPSDAVIGVSQADRRRMAETENLIQAHRAIPFSLFKDSSKFYRWLYSEQQFLQDADARKMIEGFYQRFANFMVPVVALSPETGKDNIVNIFERINRTEISLSLFDLAAARLYLKGIKLRKLWRAFEERDKAAAKVIKPEFLLKMVALLQGKEPRKGTLLDVIDALSAKEFEARWETAIEFIAKAYQRITSTAGYGAFDPKWIPYTTLIVPLAALLHWLEKHKGGEDSYRKVDRWYWTNVFAQRYDQAVDTNTYRDVKEVTQWLAGESPPDWMAKLSVDRIDPNVNESRSAVYKGMICLVVLAGAKDFLDGQEASLQTRDDDHIFPKSRFAGSESINSILNRTLISKRTNEVKGKKKPTEYLPLFLFNHGNDLNRLCQTFQSHLVSSQALEAMKRDAFDAFLEARRLAFLEEIRQRIGQL
jgi:hypothetical protein